jgi:hypothetical protein
VRLNPEQQFRRRGRAFFGLNHAQSVASSDERDEFASIRLLETEVSRLKKIVILLS